MQLRTLELCDIRVHVNKYILKRITMLMRIIHNQTCTVRTKRDTCVEDACKRDMISGAKSLRQEPILAMAFHRNIHKVFFSPVPQTRQTFLVTHSNALTHTHTCYAGLWGPSLVHYLRRLSTCMCWTVRLRDVFMGLESSCCT